MSLSGFPEPDIELSEQGLALEGMLAASENRPDPEVEAVRQSTHQSAMNIMS